MHDRHPSALSGCWPRHDDPPAQPLRPWQIVLGSLGFAGAAFALIWAGTILAWAAGLP